jgi:HAD superfamily hydrolase (TIGR01509 family)
VILMAKAVIFDWDGTIADTKKAVIQSFQKVLTEAGCKVTDEFILRLMGIGTKKTIIKAFKECNKRLNVSKLEKLAEEKVNIQSELTDIVRFIDGAIELLEALFGKTKIALATMSSRRVVEKILSEKKIKKYFDVVVTADEVNKPKPNPEIFLLSATKLGVDQKDCVVIEDSIFGVRAAKKAKMKCVAVPSGVYNKEELEQEHPDFVVKSLVEKKVVLDFILRENES